MVTSALSREEALKLTRAQRSRLRKKGANVPLRPQHAPRLIEIRGDVGVVPLTRGYEALIDAEDAERLGRWLWCACKGQSGVYAIRHSRERGGAVFLHKEVLGVRDGVVDHKDSNTLDCRKSNLRPAEWWQNIANQRLSPRNTTGFRGVCRHKNGRWRAGIKRGNDKIHIGYFATAEEAARAYDLKAIELFGEFARLNFSPEKTPSYMRLVRHADIPKFEAAGWVVVGGPDRLGPTHGEWSCLMMWTGEGSPEGVA